MRTTLTLDDDVVALLKRAQARRKQPLKKLVNDALREGLVRMTARRPAPAPYRTRSMALGRCLLGSLDDVTQVLAVAEGEHFR